VKVASTSSLHLQRWPQSPHRRLMQYDAARHAALTAEGAAVAGDIYALDLHPHPPVLDEQATGPLTEF
jgi:hypothetical protein